MSPPEPPGTILWLARELPEPQPKSFGLAWVCIGGRGLCKVGEVGCGVGSGVLQASLEPHASVLLPQPILEAAGGCGADWVFGGGADRLNTEVSCGGGEAIVCFGGMVCVEVAPKSNRSSNPELALVCGIGELPGAESKAPNPLEELKVLLF